MQTWAKRGFQAALVTGGMLVLGAGIANASEDTPSVNPLGVPMNANFIDVDASIPVKAQSNQIGTPVGPLNTPGVQQSVSTREIT
ncbi:MAG: hypothetical protein JO285_00355, partial [Kutzneria sp.]|nr:hypothetical protein [Kutzneria sp.]